MQVLGPICGVYEQVPGDDDCHHTLL